MSEALWVNKPSRVITLGIPTKNESPGLPPRVSSFPRFGAAFDERSHPRVITSDILAKNKKAGVVPASGRVGLRLNAG